jgi:integrase
MKNKAYADSSITSINHMLTLLSKHANLNEPESVERYIASLQRTQTYKANLCKAYQHYCKHYGIEWEVPKYSKEAKLIKIPTNEKLEMLISSAGRILSIKLAFSKETGLRPIELCNLKVKDIDLDQRIVYPTTAKHGAARTIKISTNLTKTLKTYIIRNNLNPNDKLFIQDATHYGKDYREMRNNLAKKLNDPTLRTIRLYDFRHFFATTLYHKTRDILFVKQQMGHKNINTTLIYTQLLNLNDDEWTCKTANNVNDATALIEAGFEYVTDMDGLKIFRKRK